MADKTFNRKQTQVVVAFELKNFHNIFYGFKNFFVEVNAGKSFAINFYAVIAAEVEIVFRPNVL